MIERSTARGDDPPDGTPSGTLRETAANLVTDLIPDYTVPEYKDGVAYFQYEVAGPARPHHRLRPAHVRRQQRRAGARGDGGERAT